MYKKLRNKVRKFIAISDKCSLVVPREALKRSVVKERKKRMKKREFRGNRCVRHESQEKDSEGQELPPKPDTQIYSFSGHSPLLVFFQQYPQVRPTFLPAFFYCCPKGQLLCLALPQVSDVYTLSLFPPSSFM